MSDVTEAAPPAPETAKPDGPPAFAKVIADHGRVVLISRESDGAIVLTPSGRVTPFRFDRFQVAALRDALAEAVDDKTGHVFERRLSRAITPERARSLAAEIEAQLPDWRMRGAMACVMAMILAAGFCLAKAMDWIA
ncbi:MAG: hypothetical protein JWR10_3412 [Rubritepida sp.]|nr:hypothetical protein [Rubritepida sp.]